VKVALVHDWLNQMGGAENVLEALVELYPESPVYTSIYAANKMPDFYKEWDIRTLWMDSLPGIYDHHQMYLTLYPKAFGGLDLSDYDVVLTNKSGFCHGVKTGDALHVCYCLAPTRYLWQYNLYMKRENFPPVANAILKPVIASMKRWDYEAAQCVHHFVAISSDIQQRIARFYNRESVIIFPPVETGRYQPSETVEDYYLVVSRLIPYKRIDLAVRACSALGLPLKVVGSGRDRERLERIAGPSVEFLGRVPDEDLPDLYARCRAFIFPGLEDFGIAPVEAQAAGRPVVAFRGGGALDTVIEGETGLLFAEATVESLQAALLQIEDMTFDVAACVRNAERFSRDVFDKALSEFMSRSYEEYRTGTPR